MLISLYILIFLKKIRFRQFTIPTSMNDFKNHTIMFKWKTKEFRSSMKSNRTTIDILKDFFKQLPVAA